MSGPLVRIVEGITINLEIDPWFDLRALHDYSTMSVRFLRASLTDPYHPLPHYRMKEPRVTTTKGGKPRTVSGKILVRRSDFDRWMEHFRQTLNVDKLVNEVTEEFRVY